MNKSRNLYQAISLPTGEIINPVCVGDLPTYDYSVAAETAAEDVTKYFDSHTNLPGVILTGQGRLLGMISRRRIFERLGRFYGVELFLRKPIIRLYQNLGLKLYSLSSSCSIKEAVHYALNRSSKDIYEPIVLVSEDGEFRLLDVETLLIAQSRTMDHLNNLVSNLNRIKLALADNSLGLQKTLDMIMKGLQQVVPYHHASIHIKEAHGVSWALQSISYPDVDPRERIDDSPFYEFILNISQPLCIEDIREVSNWKEVSALGDLRTWMGLPLRNEHDPLGVLSLARRSRSPFNKDELDIAQAFADYITAALNKSTKPTKRIFLPLPSQ